MSVSASYACFMKIHNAKPQLCFRLDTPNLPSTYMSKVQKTRLELALKKNLGTGDTLDNHL